MSELVDVRRGKRGHTFGIMVLVKRVHSWRWPLFFARRWSHLPRWEKAQSPATQAYACNCIGISWVGFVGSCVQRRKYGEKFSWAGAGLGRRRNSRASNLLWNFWKISSHPPLEKERRTTLQSTQLLSSFGKQHSAASETRSGRGRGKVEGHGRQQLCPWRAGCSAGCSHKSSHFVPLKTLL